MVSISVGTNDNVELPFRNRSSEGVLKSLRILPAIYKNNPLTPFQEECISLGYGQSCELGHNTSMQEATVACRSLE